MVERNEENVAPCRDMERPVFVVGYQRSGTTLVREEVSAHPDFCIPPESSFLTWLYPEFSDWRQQDCQTPRVTVFAKALSQARKFWHWDLGTKAVLDQISRDQPANYAELASAVYRAYCTKVGKPRAQWGDKNNVHGLHLSTIMDLYPEARIIWVVRDPRDVWSSLKKLSLTAQSEGVSDIAPRAPLTVEDFCEEWNAYNAAVQVFLIPRPLRSQALLVRYEDFVTHAEGSLVQLYEFLGACSSLSSRRKRSYAEIGPEAALNWKDGIADSPHMRSVGAFRGNLSGRESWIIEESTWKPFS